MSSLRGQHQGPGPDLGKFEAFAAAWRSLSQPVYRATPLDPRDLQTALSMLSPELSRRRASGVDMNVWKIAGVARNEVRNTAAVAWLLSPQGSHGLEGRVLAAVLNSLCPGQTLTADSVACAIVVAEERPMGSLDDRIDIAIDTGDQVIFIEAKIDAPFAPGQVDRYREQLRLKAIAYGAGSTLATLTVKPSPFENVPSLTWAELACTIRSALATTPETLGKALALQYANHIEQFW